MSKGQLLLERLESILGDDSLSVVGRAGLTQPVRRLRACQYNNYCRLQICTRCALRRSRRTEARLLRLANQTKLANLWFVTLARPAETIALGLEALKRAWGKLRRRGVWNAVVGGFVSREIERGPQNWHTHQHILVATSKPLDGPAIRETWHQLTGIRTSTTCEPVLSREGVAQYTTKRRPQDWLTLEEDKHLLEIADAHMGAYLQTFFGEWLRRRG